MSSTVSLDAPAPSKGLHLGLWAVQGLLAFAFFAAGAFKATQPIDQLAANGMAWVTYSPAWLVRFVGVAELLGAVGLILPSALRILPKLTAVAAAALALVMVLAAGMHTANGEGGLPVNVVLGGLAAFVAWGRAVAAPIAPKA